MFLSRGRSFLCSLTFGSWWGVRSGAAPASGLPGSVAERFGEVFPLGTLFVNVTGSLIIGFVAALTEPGGGVLVSPRMRQFILIGVCGGYTTFSSFSLQTLNLVRDGDWLRAGLNSVLVVGLLFARGLARADARLALLYLIRLTSLCTFLKTRSCCAFTSAKAIAGTINRSTKQS